MAVYRRNFAGCAWAPGNHTAPPGTTATGEDSYLPSIDQFLVNTVPNLLFFIKTFLLMYVRKDINSAKQWVFLLEQLYSC
jgi:hypothetical protein